MESRPNLIACFRSAIAIFAGLYCLWLFPSPAFDACFPYSGSQYGCGVWPDIYAGFSFLMITFFVGPAKSWHYLIVLILFLFVGSAELIRFGSIQDALFYAPYQRFYYGGAIAMAVYFTFRHYRTNKPCT
jgi:hypothetical protein